VFETDGSEVNRNSHMAESHPASLAAVMWSGKTVALKFSMTQRPSEPPGTLRTVLAGHKSLGL
jgi:hypothetical protein